MGSHVVSNRYGIYNTQITEEGDYSCSATNAAGSGASEPVTITFIGKWFRHTLKNHNCIVSLVYN